MSNFKYNITNFEDLLLDLFSDENDLKVDCSYIYKNKYHYDQKLYSFVKHVKKCYKTDDIIDVDLYLCIKIMDNDYKNIVLSDFFIDRLKRFKNEMNRMKLPFNFECEKHNMIIGYIHIDKISVKFNDIILCTTNNRFSENKFGIFFNSLSDSKYSIYSMDTNDKFTFAEIDKKSKHIEDIKKYKYEVQRGIITNNYLDEFYCDEEDFNIP